MSQPYTDLFYLASELNDALIQLSIDMRKLKMDYESDRFNADSERNLAVLREIQTLLESVSKST